MGGIAISNDFERLINTAKELFAGSSGLSGPQLFDFFASYSDTIAKMRYGSDVPSRKEMFENFLESLVVAPT